MGDAVVEPFRNARGEADERLGGRYRALVLEPSPPAVGEPWFADDPTDPASPPSEADDRPLVSPVGNGDLTWQDLCDSGGDDAELGPWCAARGLAAWPRLPDRLPPAFIANRLALQSVAEHVVCPARHRVNGKIGLRFTIGGFGTPFFRDGDDDRQVRVEKGVLVVQDGAGTHRHELTTLAAAAEAAAVPLGAPTEIFEPTTAADPDAPLTVDPESAALHGQWYALVASVLEELRAESPPGDPVTRVELWPEHFDLAVDLGTETDDTRVTYGASPGDAPNPEPYFYVLPWADVERGGFWNAESYTGAILRYADLVGEADQRAAALAFLRKGQEVIGEP